MGRDVSDYIIIIYYCNIMYYDQDICPKINTGAEFIFSPH
jgi:hypothetical protein